MNSCQRISLYHFLLGETKELISTNPPPAINVPAPIARINIVVSGFGKQFVNSFSLSTKMKKKLGTAKLIC